MRGVRAKMDCPGVNKPISPVSTAAAMGRLRVFAMPARRNSAENPYNSLLSDALTDQGCEVVELPRYRSFLNRADIVHIHWPQNLARGGLACAATRVALLIARLVVLRLKGARIVWTVHNVHDHEQNNVWLESYMLRALSQVVDGLIFLSESSRASAYCEVPALASKPAKVIPHGLYGIRSNRTRQAARERLRIAQTAHVIGFLGTIRRSKGLGDLLTAMTETKPGRVTLLIAGVARDSAYRAEIENQIAALLAAGHAIIYRERRLGDEDLTDAIRACDLVALPYRIIWNSGMAMLVLENRARVLASDAPIFRELQQEVGEDQVYIFRDRLTGHALVNALEREVPDDESWFESFCSKRSWAIIGTSTVAFYRNLMTQPRSGETRRR